MRVLRRHYFLYLIALVMLGLLMAQPDPLGADKTKVKIFSSKDRGWLGVSIQELNEEIVEARDLPDDRGVLINEVFEESPAEKAGLKAGDVVTKYGDTAVEDISRFVKLVRESEPGGSVSLTLLRDGKSMELDVEIGERPKGEHHIELLGDGDHHDWEFTEGFPYVLSRMPRFFGGGYIGVRIHDLNDQLADALGLKEAGGALVLEAEEDGPAYEAGIRGGDVIVKVDEKEIADTDDLRSLIGEKKEGDEVEVTVYRDKKRKSFKVPVHESPGLSAIHKEIIIPELDLEDIDLNLEGLEDLQIEIQSEIEEEMADLKAELEALKQELKEMKKEKE